MNEQININQTPIVAFASGKGGAGKTSTCLNFATSLAKKGKKVLVFDADFGLANIDVQLGITPSKDLSHVISGTATLEETITKSDRGFYVIPGRSGSENLPFINTLERRDILKKLRDLAGAFDVVFLDVAAGVGDEVLTFANFADTTLLVVTPDPSSITDAYAVIKLMKLRHEKTNCKVLVTQAGGEMEGKQTYEKLKKAAENFLKIEVPLLGVIPYDRQYAAAVKMQKLCVDAFPDSKASERIAQLALNLL